MSCFKILPYTLSGSGKSDRKLISCSDSPPRVRAYNPSLGLRLWKLQPLLVIEERKKGKKGGREGERKRERKKERKGKRNKKL